MYLDFATEYTNATLNNPLGKAGRLYSMLPLLNQSDSGLPGLTLGFKRHSYEWATVYKNHALWLTTADIWGMFTLMRTGQDGLGGMCLRRWVSREHEKDVMRACIWVEICVCGCIDGGEVMWCLRYGNMGNITITHLSRTRRLGLPNG